MKDAKKEFLTDNASLQLLTHFQILPLTYSVGARDTQNIAKG